MGISKNLFLVLILCLIEVFKRFKSYTSSVLGDSINVSIPVQFLSNESAEIKHSM